MGIDILALAPYAFITGMVALLAFGAAALACAVSVGASSYFVWLCQLHLLKQNDRLTRRVVAFSENEDAKKLVGYEAMAEVSHEQTEMLNRLEGLRAQAQGSGDPYEDLAQ